MSEDQNENHLNIELNEEVAEGTYSNLAIITHSSSEFIFDFVRLMPGVPKAKVKSRVFMTPQHAKRLLHALNENMRKYEQQHGMVADLEQQHGFPMGFGGPAGEA